MLRAHNINLFVYSLDCIVEGMTRVSSKLGFSLIALMISVEVCVVIARFILMQDPLMCEQSLIAT